MINHADELLVTERQVSNVCETYTNYSLRCKIIKNINIKSPSVR